MKIQNILITVSLTLLSAATAAQEYRIQFNNIDLSLPEPENYESCDDIQGTAKDTGDGQYAINPTGNDEFTVYCDMTTDGGGWTRVGYQKDLSLENRWGSGDEYRWLGTNFSKSNGYLELSSSRIEAIRSVSSEAKQTYVATCEGVIHYYNETGNNYDFTAGFELEGGTITNKASANYDIPITIKSDGCKINSTNSLEKTVFEINHIDLPVLNITTRDSGDSGEYFGAKLSNNPAWFR